MSNSRKQSNANLNSALFALSLDPKGKSSLQSQLTALLRTIIVSSQEYAGTALPASRALATELSVSRTTVQAAYDQLISEGYLMTRRGSGTFIAEHISHLSPPSVRHSAGDQKIEPWKPFQIGLPDSSLLPHALWARHLDRSWRNPRPELLGSPDPLGWYELRSAIAEHLAAWRNLECNPEQVVITSGAWESFEFIFRCLLEAAKTAAIEDPCWPRVRTMLELSGCKFHPVRVDENGLDASKIPTGVSAAIVTASRHYPTGCSLPLTRRIEVLDWALKNNGLVIEDDYDSEFRYQGQPLPSLSGLDRLQHTIYLGSFSKLISPALRIGYVVVPNRLLSKARSYFGSMGTRASLIPQPALAGFMNSGEFSIHLRRMRRIYARRQNHLISELEPVQDLLVINPDAAGMHICLPLSSKLLDQTSDQEICRLAQRSGISVGALSSHCVLPDKPQALLMGYAAFDEYVLSQAAGTLINILLKFQ